MATLELDIQYTCPRTIPRSRFLLQSLNLNTSIDDPLTIVLIELDGWTVAASKKTTALVWENIRWDPHGRVVHVLTYVMSTARRGRPWRPIGHFRRAASHAITSIGRRRPIHPCRGGKKKREKEKKERKNEAWDRVDRRRRFFACMRIRCHAATRELAFNIASRWPVWFQWRRIKAMYDRCYTYTIRDE